MHKWMYQTYDIGCVLIRDDAAHKAALETGASYLSPIKGGLRDAPDDLSSYAIQLSRGFRALKIWFALTSDGVSAYRNAIEQNLALADCLRDRIDGDRRLERLAAVPLHIVNFRYIDGVEESRLDVVNEEIVRRLHIEGIAVPSPTFIRGRFSIRVCISNHRTRHEDIDLFLSAVLNIGRQLEAEQFGVAKGGL